MPKKTRTPERSAWRLLDFQTIGSTLAWSVAAWSISVFLLSVLIDPLLQRPFTIFFVLPSIYVTLAAIWRSRQSTRAQQIGEGLLTGAVFFILLTAFVSILSLIPSPASPGQ